MMAVKLFTPNIPRLEMVNVPPCIQYNKLSLSLLRVGSVYRYLIFMRFEFVGPGPSCKSFDLVGDGAQPLALHPGYDGRDEPGGCGGSDTDVNRVIPGTQQIDKG